MQRNAKIELGWEKPRRRGVTALARRVGVTKGYMSLVLNGKMKPGAALVKKLARLGVTVGA